MTQLTDDCFAFGGGLQTLDKALERIKASVRAIHETEKLPLVEAVGKVAASDVIAMRNVPPHNNSAVDGYAVKHTDLNADAVTQLVVEGRIAAGQTTQELFNKPNQALRIFTGAMIPDGFDTIFMQEDVQVLDDASIHVPSGLKEGSNLRQAGEDVAVGVKLVSKGQVLRPQDLALLAGQGHSLVEITRQLRVGVISTGNELSDSSLAAGQVFDTNQTMLVSALRGIGLAAEALGIIPDRQAETEAFLSVHAPNFDLLITTGGVSTGDEDHVKASVEAVGRLDFWRIALKPGRPVALGEIGSCVLVGLPGNPVAAMVTFISLVQPLIRQLQGRSAIHHKPIKAMLTNKAKKKASRREFLRVSETGFTSEGVLLVEQHPAKGAGITMSLAGSDGLLILPDDLTNVEAMSGTFDYLRYSDVLGSLS